MNFKDVLVKESQISQFEDNLGVFTKKDFKKGDIVIQWNLKTLTQEEYKNLSEYERINFCHTRNNTIYYYPDPEQHVNRSKSPNVFPDFEKKANIALRDIQNGEELSILESTVEDF